MTINLGIGWVLFIVFMVMKLTGFIAWSWWWVTAPLWGFAGLSLLLGFLTLLAFGADHVMAWRKKVK